MAYYYTPGMLLGVSTIDQARVLVSAFTGAGQGKGKIK